MVTTFLIGNGIGMAVDNNKFSLKKAMKRSWSELLKKQKDIIKEIIGIHKSPKSETDLRDLQRVLWYIAANSQEEEYKDLFEATRTFLFKIVKTFFDVNSNEVSSSILIKSISNFVNHNKGTNIATLNYDKLLYGSFTAEKGVLATYKLIDGFFGQGNPNWNPEGCKDSNQDKGWYLALHGSPVFCQGNDESIYKENITEVEGSDELLENVIKNHLVLTDPNFKMVEISKSKVLKYYWEILENDILQNTSNLVVIGYSGGDPHLNEVIRKTVQCEGCTMKIYVIEWDCDKKFAKFDKDNNYIGKRNIFWQAKFGSENIVYRPVSNILSIDVAEVLNT